MSDAPFRFVRTYPDAVLPPGPAIQIQFQNGELIFHDEAFTPHPLSAPPERSVYLGKLDGIPCVGVEIDPAKELTSHHQTLGLRGLYGKVGDAEYALAGYAAQILRWRRTSRFCSACSTPLRNLPGSWGRECPACGTAFYPPVSPAVLALVHDGNDRVLLAQKPGWGKRYSILAGFVEPGESLEECTLREVYEEVGLLVEAPVYAGSQSWPFPHQIMVGFTCHYVRGDLKLDETELERAAWFRYDELPELPPSLSLSRQIIDRWVQSRQ